MPCEATGHEKYEDEQHECAPQRLSSVDYRPAGRCLKWTKAIECREDRQDDRTQQHTDDYHRNNGGQAMLREGGDKDEEPDEEKDESDAK